MLEKIGQNKERQLAKDRNLSSHVGTRWYRAPEVLIMEKHYDQASDMWSFGCVLHELLYINYVNKAKTTIFSSYKCDHDVVLFRGTKCYPLSPTPDSDSEDNNDQEDKNTKNDQINLITQKTGQISEDDLSFI